LRKRRGVGLNLETKPKEDLKQQAVGEEIDAYGFTDSPAMQKLRNK
jgi:hypothetical protein